MSVSDARWMARRSAATSSDLRSSYSAKISCTSRSRQKKPLPGRKRSRPSMLRRFRASRSGVRETPSSLDSATSLRRSPGLNSKSIAISRMRK
ncbi:hypothetical protein D3C72_1981860 [compost metagenome]